MKIKIPILYLVAITLLTFCGSTLAQNRFFEMFNDSTAIKKKSIELIADFQRMIDKQDQTIALKNPQVAYGAWGPFYLQQQNTIYLPVWSISPREFQGFCVDVAGNEAEGEKVFGLFFNGFYVAHEVAHAFQYAANKLPGNEYDKEYIANVVAMLYWKAKGKQKELDACYRYALKGMAKLKNPIPEGEEVKEYFTEHYWEMAQDPYKYGYIQFSQFIEVYENELLPDFKSYVTQILK